MCEYSGCNQVPAVRAPTDEHAELLDHATAVRSLLRKGELADARTSTAQLVSALRDHVRREERGIFAALRDAGEFVVDYPGRLAELFDQLAEHIEREEPGVFPVAIVTLGARGWQLVDAAR